MTASKPAQQPQDATEEQTAPKTLYEAILRVQGELPKVGKDATNPHFKSKYVTLDALMDAVMPVLNRNSLVWITEPCRDEDRELALRYRLVFVGGIWRPGEVVEIVDNDVLIPPSVSEYQEIRGTMALLAAKDDPQGQGAALTYARRYALTAVLGITADEDDDGQRAVRARQESQQRQREARDPHRPMPDDAMARMAHAAAEAGLDLVELGAKAGVEEGQVPTIAQGRKIKELIKEANPPVDGAPS